MATHRVVSGTYDWRLKFRCANNIVYLTLKGAVHTVMKRTTQLLQLLLSCAKSHMLSASRRQPHRLHVSAVDRRQIWSMDKSWRCVTLSGFPHSHIVHCWWNPISCGTHYSGPGLSEMIQQRPLTSVKIKTRKSDCGSIAIINSYFTHCLEVYRLDRVFSSTGTRLANI